MASEGPQRITGIYYGVYPVRQSVHLPSIYPFVIPLVIYPRCLFISDDLVYSCNTVKLCEYICFYLSKLWTPQKFGRFTQFQNLALENHPVCWIFEQSNCAAKNILKQLCRKKCFEAIVLQFFLKQLCCKNILKHVKCCQRMISSL